MKIKRNYLNLAVIFATLSISHATYAQDSASKGTLKNESEAGVVITGGNSQVSTISFKQLNSYQWSSNTAKFNGGYLRSSTAGTETALRWNGGLRYERALSDNYSLFAGQGVESDKFQNLLQRYTTDLGGKYIFIKKEELNWFAEAGYRFQRDNYVSFFKNFNYARIYTEAVKAFNKSVSAKLWVEYLPNITTWQDYQINGELSLSAVLSEVFSLKTGYLLRFDNMPAPGVAFKTDSTFTTALVAKY